MPKVEAKAIVGVGGGRGESHGQRKQLRCGAPARSRLLFMPYMIKHSLWEGGPPYDCSSRATFYVLHRLWSRFLCFGVWGIFASGPPHRPPPPPPQVLYAAATIIPSLYLFKGLIDSAVWGRWGGGGGDRDEYITVHMLCRLTVIRGGGDTCVQSSQMIHDKYVIIEHVE